MVKKASERVAELAALYTKLNLKSQVDPARWKDQTLRAAAANKALKFQNVLTGGGATEKAFNRFALSPDDPDHWRELLDVLADVHFGKPQKTGPKKASRWTDARKHRLAEHFVAIIQEMKSKKVQVPHSLEAVAKMIKMADEAKKQRDKAYADTTSRQMYQQLRTFFSRDNNSDPQFLSWIAERLG